MQETLSQKIARVRKEEGLASIGTRAIKALGRRVWAPIGMFYYADVKGDLRKEMLKVETNAVNALDFAFHKFGEFIKPFQHWDEILRLAELVERAKPRVVVEIGTARGGTLFLFARLAAPDALLASIDLPGGEYGAGYPAWKVPYYKRFARKGQRIELMRANSHDPKTVAKLEKVLGGKKIDFLFIDGDHTYEGVKKDYELYSPLVRTGGIIALHDVRKHRADLECYVDLFWNEVKQGKKYEEFITPSQDPKDQWGGIGVIHKEN